MADLLGSFQEIENTAHHQTEQSHQSSAHSRIHVYFCRQEASVSGIPELIGGMRQAFGLSQGFRDLGEKQNKEGGGYLKAWETGMLTSLSQWPLGILNDNNTLWIYSNVPKGSQS